MHGILTKNNIVVDDCKYMFITTSLSVEEYNNSIVSEDDGGRLLRSYLERSKIRLKSCYFTCIYKFINSASMTINESLAASCIASVHGEVAHFNPKVIFAVGNDTFELLTGKKPNVRFRNEGTTLKINNVDYKVILLYNPIAVLRGGQQFESSIIKELINQRVLIDGNNGDIKDFKVLSTVPEVVDYIDYLIESHKNKTLDEYICIDIETTTLSPYDAEADILMLAITHKEHQSYIIPICHRDSPLIDSAPVIKYHLKKLLLSGIPVSNQNIKFDYNYLRKILEVDRFNAVGDSMLASYVLSNKSVSHSLDSIVTRCLSEQSHKQVVEDYLKKLPKEEKSYSNIPATLLYPYTFDDSERTFRATKILESKLKSEGIYKFYKEFLVPGTVSFLADMEYYGANINQDLMSEVHEHYSKLVIDSIQTMISIPEAVEAISEYYNYQFKDGYYTVPVKKEFIQVGLLEIHPYISFASSKFVSILIFDKLKLVASKGVGRGTSKIHTNDILLKLKDPDDRDYRSWDPLKRHTAIAFLESLLLFRKNNKLLTSYLTKLPLFIKQDGFIHTNFKPHATDTGRCSNDEPALQTIPAFSRIKDLFTSRYEGGGILSVDYSQAELRVVAMVAQDAAMKKAFESGIDIHTVTTSEIFDLPINAVPKHLRRHTKTIVFGMLYGRSARAIAFELNLEESEAQAMINKFYKARPQVKDWIDQQHHLMSQRVNTVTTPLGRRLLIFEQGSYDYNAACRHSVNYPIQGTASDFTWHAGRHLCNEIYRLGLKSRPFNFVHDSIIIDIYPGELHIIQRICEYYMVDNPHKEWDFCFGVPLKADYEFGSRWGKGIDLSYEDDKVYAKGSDKKLSDAMPSLLGQNYQLVNVEDLGMEDGENMIKYTFLNPNPSNWEFSGYWTWD